MAHTSNPCYMEGGDGRIMVQGWPQENLVRHNLENKVSMWCTHVNPEIPDVQVGGSWSEVGLRQKPDPTAKGAAALD
jgi:hypothetical protein